MARNEEGLPSLKKDLQNSILFLQQCGASGGDSLFDHLSNVISKVIDERPKNVVDYFEQFSERVRLETFRMDESLLEKGYKEPQRLVIAQKLLPKLIEKSKQPIKDAADEEEETLEQSMDDEEGDVIYHEPPARDLCELQFYWNLLGIGFPREEVFSIVCSVAKLKKTNPTMASCRFWGKMLGLKNDYYIVESTLTVSTLEDTIVSCMPEQFAENGWKQNRSTIDFFSPPCSYMQKTFLFSLKTKFNFLNFLFSPHPHSGCY